MKSFITRGASIALIVGAGILTLAGIANASRVVVEVTGIDQVKVGVPAQFHIALHDAETGLPVVDTPVTIFTNATFAGVSGEVKLGSAVTDQNGVAVITHEPRSANVHELRVEYLLHGSTEPEVATVPISVADGPQLSRSASGIQVPGLNVWLIIAIVAGVWSLLFSVGLRVFAIARADGTGRDDHARAERLPRTSGGREHSKEQKVSDA
jgi:hypothetical protein